MNDHLLCTSPLLDAQHGLWPSQEQYPAPVTRERTTRQGQFNTTAATMREPEYMDLEIFDRRYTL